VADHPRDPGGEMPSDGVEVEPAVVVEVGEVRPPANRRDPDGRAAETRARVLDAVTARLATDLGDVTEPLLVVLTSGTTGAPRAVIRTLTSWTSSHRMVDTAFGLRPDDVIWAPGALSSTLTLFAAHHAHTTGRRAVLSGPWHGVEAALAEGAGDATVIQAVPPIVADVLDAVDAGRLPRLRVAVVAGARVPALLHDRARALGVRLIEYYGAAELSFVACGRDAASLGAFEGVEIEVRAGVVWVRSPYTAEPGWQTVGDTGTWDGHRLRLGGRPGTVTTAGATVVLAEVEAALDGRATCFGVLRESVGEALAAAVTDADELPVLQALARSRLSPAQRPRVWLVVEEIPLTPAGKVDRAALSRRRAPGSPTRPAPAAPPRSP